MKVTINLKPHGHMFHVQIHLCIKFEVANRNVKNVYMKKTNLASEQEVLMALTK